MWRPRNSATGTAHIASRSQAQSLMLVVPGSQTRTCTLNTEGWYIVQLRGTHKTTGQMPRKRKHNE